LLVVGLILLIMVGESISNGPPPLKVWLSPIQIGMFVAMAGMVIGWWYEGLGAGVIFAGCALMFGYERIAWGHWLGGAFPLFLIPGVFLLITKLQVFLSRCK
jgi:hypothetical protein